MTPQADLGTWGSRATLMEQLFNAISARFNLNVIYDMECRTGRVYAKGKPDREMSFGKAVAMVHKANRGEPLIWRSHYTPRGKGLDQPSDSLPR